MLYSIIFLLSDSLRSFVKFFTKLIKYFCNFSLYPKMETKQSNNVKLLNQMNSIILRADVVTVLPVVKNESAEKYLILS